MRERRDPSSPFGVRLYFETDEFETIAEELLAKAGNEVFVEGRGIDVDLPMGEKGK